MKLALKSLFVIACIFGAILIFAAALVREDNAAEKLVSAASPTFQQANAHDSAMQSTTITKFHGFKDETGVILHENLTIKNDGPVAVKDITIKCNNIAPSGTVIDSNERTIYEVVPARKTRTFRDFNMGFINPQSSASSCEIKDLTIDGAQSR